MNRTNRVGVAIVVSLLVVGMAAPWANDATPQCRVVGPHNPLPEPGDYLATAYYDTIMRTLSPSAAGDTTRLPFARVTREEGGLTLAMGTFEEGAGEIVLSSSGVARPGQPDGECTVVLSDTSHFALAAGAHTPLAKYTRVGELDAWVSNLLFVGRWTDSAGRLYVFARDGNATFDGKSVRYSVSEPDGNGFEDGRIVIDGHNFSFERAGSALNLYGPLDGHNPAPLKPMYALKVVPVVR
jgi:hypothetical protein